MAAHVQSVGRTFSADRERVAGNIRAEMARGNITQGAIANALGLTQQAVSRRLKGVVAIDLDELAVIAEVLGTTRAALLGDDSPARSAS